MPHDMSRTLQSALDRPIIFPTVKKPASAHFHAPSAGLPKLADETFQGLPGEIVKAIEPYSEAHPAALLVNLLTAFGNLIGSTPHFLVEFCKHHARLFVALVGETSKGRKGTSWSAPKHLMSLVDPEWVDDRVGGSLSSGEGLIYNVRDERREQRPIKEKNRITSYEEEIVDHGVEDKRLLVVEGELASALKVMSRDGNTLSPTLRQAWDDGNLRPLTKNNPIRATGAHISIIGHITKQELLRHLNETEKANGFANRFIWLAVQRSKAIPNPKGVPSEILAPLVEKMSRSVQSARKMGLVTRSDSAEVLWSEVYSELSEGHAGMFGAVTGRAEAQVMRLALIYALMDESALIEICHLKAALALWDYAETSARWIFENEIGDPTADMIVEALKTGPMSDGDIHNHFARHKTFAERARALNFLQKQGIVVGEVDNSTGGRPKKVWRLVCAKSAGSA